MSKFYKKIDVVSFCFITLLVLLSSCGPKIKETADSVYSRHLQEHIKLSVLSSPAPDDKNSFNLLLVNDGQNIAKLGLKNILDSLYKIKMLEPLVVVAINAFDREQEYGVAGFPDYKNKGASADKYEKFIVNELYPYIKKMTGVRKFHSIGIAGFSLGGVSALDIAWENADKIDKVGIFSGSFWIRDKDASDSSYSDEKNRIMMNKIKSSRKRPKLKYWFYVGENEEIADRDRDGITDVVDDTKDLIGLLKQKNPSVPKDITLVVEKKGKHDYESWSAVFPQFLLWAYGK